MEDEQHLASLVLLLRLPLPGDDNDNKNNSLSDKISSDDNNEVNNRGTPTIPYVERSSSTSSSTSSSGMQAMQDALERNDCELLRFVIRIIRHYTTTKTTTSSSPGGGSMSTTKSESAVHHAYLRLAIRIVFLRYVSFNENYEGGDYHESNKINNKKGRLWDYECFLLGSLLEALRTRSSSSSSSYAATNEAAMMEMEELDVEMAWVVQSLLVKLSSKSSLGNNKSVVKQSKVLSRMWTETIDMLVVRRRQCKSKEVSSSVHTNRKNDESSSSSTHYLNDEQLMIKTIHTLLDGNNSKENNQEGDNNGLFTNNNTTTDTDNNDWNMQFDISLVSFLQLYLQEYSKMQSSSAPEEEGGKHHLAKRTLWDMIHWSQQINEALSKDVYWMVLQYLQLCILGVSVVREGSNHNIPAPPRHHRKGEFGSTFHPACVAQENDDINKESKKTNDDDGVNDDEFAYAIRSFLFYGLVVLSNAEDPSSPNTMETETQSNTEGILPQILNETYPSTSMRGDIYSLVFDLWQMFGTEWLSIPSSTKPSTSTYSWWWFQSGDNRDEEHRLGPTWPLCTLISLAAGEFRLGLGRWVTIAEDETTKDSSAAEGNDCAAGLISEIHACGRIVTEAVHLMMTIAEDEDALVDWSPDAILHIRKSLEDALNSSVQYFNTRSEESNNGSLMGQSRCRRHVVFSEEQEEIGRTCCVVMGTIASELEAEHLLAAAPSAGIHQLSQHELKEEKSVSSFAYALREGILFCHSLGERQFLLDDGDRDKYALGSQKSYEYYEPLTHLLQCIMSLVSNMTSCEEDDKSMGEELQIALEVLCKDDCLVVALSKFLHRASKYWHECLEGSAQNVSSRVDDSVVQQLDGMVSMVKICALIIDELTMISNSSSQAIPVPTPEVCRELSRSLELWKKNLASSTCAWPSQILRSSAGQALDQVSHCLSILGGQSGM